MRKSTSNGTTHRYEVEPSPAGIQAEIVFAESIDVLLYHMACSSRCVYTTCYKLYKPTSILQALIMPVLPRPPIPATLHSWSPSATATSTFPSKTQATSQSGGLLVLHSQLACIEEQPANGSNFIQNDLIVQSY